MLSKHKWGIVNISFLTICSAIAQLPPQTLQMKLIFSNGATSQGKLGEKTVQALKELLAIDQTSSNTSQAPLAK